MPGERGTVRYGRPEQEPDPRDRAQLPRASCVWFFLFPPEEQAPNQPPAETAQDGTVAPPAPGDRPRHGAAARRSGARPIEAALAASQRVPIRTARLEGSLSLTGGRIDYLELSDYKVTIDPNSPIVTLLTPVRGRARLLRALRLVARPPASTRRSVPGPATVWTVESGEALTETTPVTLRWDNGAGLDLPPDDRGRRELHVHRHPVGREHHRRRGAPRALRHHRPPRHAARPQELLHPARGGDPRRRRHADRDRLQGAWPTRGRRRPRAPAPSARSRWSRTAGSASPTTTGCRRWSPRRGRASPPSRSTPPATDTFQTDMRLPVLAVAPGATASAETWLFAGAKEWALLSDYQNEKADRPLRRRHRLGLVLLPDQADLHRAARDAQADRQHGPRDHRAHLRHQADPVPARLEVLRLDVEDEGAAARDGEDQGDASATTA